MGLRDATRSETKVKVTRTICGVKLTLSVGMRYVASRAMIGNEHKRGVPVFIRDAKTFRLVRPLGIMTVRRANGFLNTFNNDPTAPWKGRIWQ
jgi:hypothetical protein